MMLKYKDPVTKEFKNITVGSAESIPVGAVLEYDGDTVPAGYVEVDESGAALEATVLYEVEGGSNLAITLNDDISNYAFLEIYYSSHNTSSHTSTKIDTTTPIVCLYTIESWGGAMEISATRYTMEGNTMSMTGTCGVVSFKIGGSHTYDVSSNHIYIYKVLGYK